MPNVKIYHDGWIALPATLRQQLALATGDELQIERVEGGLLLRVAKGAAMPVEEAMPVPVSQPVTVEPEMPVRRKPGRPKRVAAPASPVKAILPPGLRSGGRRKAKGGEASLQAGPVLVTLG